MSIHLAGFTLWVLIKATIILAAGLVASSARRRISADVRHLIVLISVGACVMLPLVLAVAPRWSVPVLPATVAPKASVVAPQRTAVATPITALPSPVSPSPATGSTVDERVGQSVEPAADHRSTLLMIVSIAWAIGVLAVLLRATLGQLRLHRIAAGAREPNDRAWQSLLSAERARLGIQTPVRLLESESATTPVTWGVRSPVILLPCDSSSWPDARRTAVLRHELVHIARADAHARWLTIVFSSVYWFHPLAWLTVRALRVESESACDDLVLASGMPAAEYAEHLLAIARTTRAPMFLVASMASPQIARRILDILDDSRRRRVLRPRTRGVTVVAATAMLLALTACQLVRRADARDVGSVPGNGSANDLYRDMVETRNTATRQALFRGEVVYDASAFAKAPQLELEAAPIATTPAAALGSENDLRFVWDAVLLSDGRIAAFRGIDPGIFIFDAGGRLQRRIGTLGKEPGEFMAPEGMTLFANDTLYVPDDADARTNWITADGGFVRAEAFVRGSRLPLRPRGQLRSRKIVMINEILPPELRDSVWRPEMPIALADPERTNVATIASVPGFELTRIVTNYHGQQRPERVGLRLGRRADVVAWDTVIAVATGENGYEIEQRNEQGTVIGLVRVERPRRATTPEMRAISIATRLAEIDGPQSERYVDIEETRREARENPFADSLPPYAGLFTTKSGILWVLDAIAPGDTAWTATAFRSDGAIVGRLHASQSSTPLYFTDDRVIVRQEDESRRVSLRVYRMVPSRQ